MVAAGKEGGGPCRAVHLELAHKGARLQAEQRQEALVAQESDKGGIMEAGHLERFQAALRAARQAGNALQPPGREIKLVEEFAPPAGDHLCGTISMY